MDSQTCLLRIWAKWFAEKLLAQNSLVNLSPAFSRAKQRLKLRHQPKRINVWFSHSYHELALSGLFPRFNFWFDLPRSDRRDANKKVLVVESKMLGCAQSSASNASVSRHSHCNHRDWTIPEPLAFHRWRANGNHSMMLIPRN